MKKALNILLVEDEFMTRRLLKKKLAEIGHNVVAEAGNTDEALGILDTEHVDLAILDINLGKNDKDGIWLGEYIRFNKQIPFIYLSAYQTTDIVNRAIDTKPYSYLTKPFTDFSLSTTLAIAAQQFEEEKTQEPVAHLVVKDGKMLKQILLSDILFFESEGNYLVLNTINKEQFRYRVTIKTVLKSLPNNTFLQTHRAFIVNKKFVTGFDANVVKLKDREVPISKGKRVEVLEVLAGRF